MSLTAVLLLAGSWSAPAALAATAVLAAGLGGLLQDFLVGLQAKRLACGTIPCN